MLTDEQHLQNILDSHVQEYTSGCGLEDTCECGHQLRRGETIGAHQASILIQAGWTPGAPPKA